MSSADTTGGDRGAQRPSVIGGLTGVRALMGTWVLADHLAPAMFLLLPGTAILRPALSGGIAIHTFFIMSGFVVTHVYAHRFRRPDVGTYRRFLRARLARLYPVHLFTLLVTAALVAGAALDGSTLNTGTRYSAWTFLGNLAVLQAVPGVDPWNWPSWSVSSELLAYLIFPLTAAVLLRLGRRSASALAVVLAVGGWALVGWLCTGAPSTALAAVLLVRPLCDFGLGCLLGAVWRRGIRRRRAWDVVAALALSGVVTVMFCASPASLWHSVTVGLLALFVLAVAGSAGPVRTLLTTPWMEWAGRTSYSRYLVHVPVLLLLYDWLPPDQYVAATLPSRVGLVALWFGATFLAGGLTYRFVEEPAHRRLGGRPRRPAVGGSGGPGPGSAVPYTVVARS